MKGFKIKQRVRQCLSGMVWMALCFGVWAGLSVVQFGCGRANSASITTYYNVEFLADGRLMATKEVITAGAASGGFFATPGNSLGYWWVVLDVDTQTGVIRGEKEIKYLGVSPTYVATAQGSPQGNYISVAGGITSETDQSKTDLVIDIYSAISLQKIKRIVIEKEIYDNSDIRVAVENHDWSPDEKKIVVQVTVDERRGVYIYDVSSGEREREISQLSSVECWGYGEGIIGINNEDIGNIRHLKVSETGETLIDIPHSLGKDILSAVQYFPDNPSEILDYGGERIISSEDFGTIARHTVLSAYWDEEFPAGVTPRVSLNPKNTRQIVFGYEAGVSNNSAYSRGIYLINLDGSGLKIVSRE